VKASIALASVIEAKPSLPQVLNFIFQILVFASLVTGERALACHSRCEWRVAVVCTYHLLHEHLGKGTYCLGLGQPSLPQNLNFIFQILVFASLVSRERASARHSGCDCRVGMARTQLLPDEHLGEGRYRLGLGSLG